MYKFLIKLTSILNILNLFLFTKVFANENKIERQV